MGVTPNAADRSSLNSHAFEQSGTGTVSPHNIAERESMNDTKLKLEIVHEED